jgi:hypothetical protein
MDKIKETLRIGLLLIGGLPLGLGCGGQAAPNPSVGADGGSGTDASMSVSEVQALLQASSNATLTAVQSAVEAGATETLDSTEPCASGTIHIKGTLDLDDLDSQFSNCEHGAYTLNGGMRTITSQSVTEETVFSYGVVTGELQVSGAVVGTCRLDYAHESTFDRNTSEQVLELTGTICGHPAEAIFSQ